MKSNIKTEFDSSLTHCKILTIISRMGSFDPIQTQRLFLFPANQNRLLLSRYGDSFAVSYPINKSMKQKERYHAPS